MARESSAARGISFVNWVVTLLLSAIPGMNIVYFIITIAFARHPAKKSYAVAALTLTLIVLVALSIAVIFFGDDIAKWLTDILEKA